MGKTLDYILIFGALIVGILLLTGHGEFFMKGGNYQARKAQYDERKMEKISGVGLILIGLATAVDSYTTTVAAKLVYIAVILIILGVMVYLLKTKCKKEK